jgi:hypothetical protein
VIDMAEKNPDKVMAGRIGGIMRAARDTDKKATGQRGQRGLIAKFEREVPDDVTDPRERARIAGLLLKAHMARLAMKSSKARRKPAA